MTQCLGCLNYTGNIGPKNVTVTNKVSREKSKCDECISGKSRFLKQKIIKKVAKININLKLFIY